MNWSYCYKIKNEKLETTNLLYTPLKNLEGNILKMKWDPNEPYQKSNKNLDQDLIDFFFDREVKYIQIFKDKKWTPNIINIDTQNKEILLEWNHESLNAIINDPNRDLNTECPDWKEQIYNILLDINEMGYYKLALYPHCFFLSKDKTIKTIDFYSVIEKSYPFVERKLIEGMIGSDSTQRFDMATTDGLINFEFFFKITMLNHLEKTWVKDNPFPDFYKRLIND